MFRRLLEAGRPPARSANKKNGRRSWPTPPGPPGGTERAGLRWQKSGTFLARGPEDPGGLAGTGIAAMPSQQANLYRFHPISVLRRLSSELLLISGHQQSHDRSWLSVHRL